MTLVVPLTVRIQTSKMDKDITREIEELKIRKSVPGGFASASFRLNRPLDFQPQDVDYFAKVYVYDGRNGNTVWEGRLEDPGRSTSVDDGETYDIVATGGKAHAQDRTLPVIYVDTSQERWERSKTSIKKALTENTEIDQDISALQVRANEGAAIDTTWMGDWIYRYLYFSSQKLARVRATIVGGATTSVYEQAIYTRTGNGGALYNLNATLSTSASTLFAHTGSASFDTNADVASFRMLRVSGTATASDLVWGQFYAINIQGQRYSSAGVRITSGTAYTTNDVDTVEVVADLLGRVLTKFDGANAYLVGSGVKLDQLAYPDGATAEEILTDLQVFDPGFYWAAWETNPATNKLRFEYRPWPTSIRYEANVDDGFDSPSSSVELYNAVQVRWRDERGRVRNTRRTQTVPVLSAAGLTREAFIDISDEMGSSTNATYVGDNFLAEHQYPPNAGTLAVSRPILDRVTGRMVQPWEILPGYLIRVRGVQPRPDALNPVSRDGVTTFRIISTEYTASTGAVLELDSYARTIQRALSKQFRTLSGPWQDKLRRR